MGSRGHQSVSAVCRTTHLSRYRNVLTCWIPGVKPDESTRSGLSNNEFGIEMHGRISTVSIKFDSDKMAVSAPALMANNSCEVSVAVRYREWGADRKGVADHHAHSVQ